MRAAVACLGAALVLALPTGPPARAGDLSTSKHNLSTSGPGPIRASAESQICIFCHTPHNARPAAPLWNHAGSTASYATYASSTMRALNPVGQPSGSSKLCLSCHDGTVALGQTINDGLIALVDTGTGGTMPAGTSDLGVDLTDDHPVSFQPSVADPETVAPPAGDPVAYDETGSVQCTSCHDPHTEDRDAVTRKFLVKGNQASAVCVTCHRPAYWSTNPSTHQTSTRTYTQTQGAHTGYSTVRDNGCESCHRPHSGTTPQRILKFVEEATCDRCHNGSVASKNISAEFNKAYVHPTYSRTPSNHDAAESPTSATHPLPETNPSNPRHAECPDCHNGHASYSRAASAPAVSGALSGTWGIDAGGARVDPAIYEYQICFKCHADSANKPQSSGLPTPPYPNRQIVQHNARIAFDPSGISYHPVEAPGRNADVPSLLAPYTTASVIYCTSCHNNDAGPGSGGTGPNGPHGSAYPHLFERNYVIGSSSGGAGYATAYALCWKCHSQSSIMGNVSFSRHSLHISGENTPCSVCHEPHGISATQGSSTNNSNLINFDTTVVRPSSSGILRFEDRGTRHGACYLTCHGDNHNPATY